MSSLKVIRKDIFNLTQCEMASLLDLSQANISKMEANDRCDKSLMQKIVSVGRERGLKIDYADFFKDGSDLRP